MRCPQAAERLEALATVPRFSMVVAFMATYASVSVSYHNPCNCLPHRPNAQKTGTKLLHSQWSTLLAVDLGSFPDGLLWYCRGEKQTILDVSAHAICRSARSSSGMHSWNAKCLLQDGSILTELACVRRLLPVSKARGSMRGASRR